ncbi:MAG TPA: exopolyphosphatase [Microscillaceae bacterium]|nr:exopolyphosphatase [Microscillaceae bacterium]
MPNPSLFAFLDLGTNTFELLIAQYSATGLPNVLRRERIFVKMGQQGISQNLIHPEAEQRIYAALATFKALLSEMQVPENQIFAVGISAFRQAQNQQAVLQAIQQQTGIRVCVISGEQEAALTFRGVQQAVPFDKSITLLMDVGGGSVEFVLADAEQIFWQKSYEIGAQRLLDGYFSESDPPTLVQRQVLEQYLHQQLETLWQALAQYPPSRWVGSSGAFESLATLEAERLQKPLSFDAKYEVVSLEALHYWHQYLFSVPRDVRQNVAGLAPQRVDMILPALTLLQVVAQKGLFTELTASFGGLREGIMDAVLAGEMSFLD